MSRCCFQYPGVAPGEIIFSTSNPELGTGHEIPADIYQYMFSCFLDTPNFKTSYGNQRWSLFCNNGFMISLEADMN